MKIFWTLKRHWGEIRWKMLIIFGFFSVISMSLMGSFAVAVVNVLIRRESAYLLEERIKLVAYARHEPIDLVGGDAHACSESQSNPLEPISRPDGLRLEGSVPVLPWRESDRSKDAWHDPGGFAGIVADRGHLEIRSFHSVERAGCFVVLTDHVALDGPFLKQLSNAAGLRGHQTRALGAIPRRRGNSRGDRG